MRLSIAPSLSLPQFDDELEIVILICQDSLPEVLYAEGLPRPDKHLLLGLVQTVVMAIEEQDSESVVSMENCSVRVDRAGEWKDVSAGLVLVKSREGRLGALVRVDSATGRRLARQAVRWFTGTIRLDVP